MAVGPIDGTMYRRHCTVWWSELNSKPASSLHAARHPSVSALSVSAARTLDNRSEWITDGERLSFVFGAKHSGTAARSTPKGNGFIIRLQRRLRWLGVRPRVLFNPIDVASSRSGWPSSNMEVMRHNVWRWAGDRKSLGVVYADVI